MQIKEKMGNDKSLGKELLQGRPSRGFQGCTCTPAFSAPPRNYSYKSTNFSSPPKNYIYKCTLAI